MNTYRVNTGEMRTVSFEAESVEAACIWVRDNSFPNYAYPRWLEVRNGSEWKGVS